MSETATVTDNRQVTDTLQQMANEMSKFGDAGSASRLTQIAEKAARNELTIAFCGHFSAGKSTLINTLVGRDLLASGPIPTSGNVVEVRHGAELASIQLKDGTHVEVPIYALGAHLRDADRVQEVHVETPLSDWPHGVAFMDTPGVDSTDDAHRIATESALHMADIVMYVTDYNHVQSDVNFQFTKMIQRQGKSVIWVVNQIDKHQEWELSFDEYREQIMSSFRSWELDAVAVYFTSMTERHHPYNQLLQLKRLLQQLVTCRAEWLGSALNQTVQDVLRQHRERLEQDQHEQRVHLETLLSSGEHDVGQLEILQERLRAVQDAPKKLEKRLKADLENLLKAAPITPYQTRELARLYLESCQPGFKVGWLLARKKTEQEIERRLTAFTADFREKVSAHIDWHVKELFVRLARDADVHDSRYEESVYALDVNVEPDWLSKKVKTGLTSNEYVLTYMDQVADEVRRRYKLAAEPLIKQAVEQKSAQSSKEQAELEEKLARFANVLQAREQLADLNQTVSDNLSKLERMWAPCSEHVEVLHNFGEWLHHAEQQVNMSLHDDTGEHSVAEQEPMALVNALPEADEHTVEVQPSVASAPDMRRQAEQMLQKAAQSLSGAVGLRSMIETLQQRASRLADNQFTIALFGAFSAGKSSFVNALVGEAILPVSPNPTTAAVNRLVQPQAGCSHGSARITFKSEENMKADIAASLAVFQEKFHGFRKLERQVSRLSNDSHRPKAKPHLAFLQAVVKGWGVMQGELGAERVVARDEYVAYAVDEHKACFVDSIDVYVDCPLTREGIQLVDTPGADSINARHTNVAFDYMKHADAIIFVTYYNHAFSQADRTFLEQLGRVKDTFEMDKMWFVINAADLAQSEEELQGVHDYVYRQLVSCGINAPRLYALSSQTALWAKQAPRGELSAEKARVYRNRLGLAPDAAFPSVETGLTLTGFKRFVHDFKHLAVQELTELAVQGARKEVQRALSAVRNYEKTAVQDEASREQQLRRVQAARQTALNRIAKLDWQAERHAVMQEVEELLYYVKQRFFHQLSSQFNQAFHPSVLKDGGSRKSQLNGCLHDLFSALEHQLTQEMLATALRVENIVHKVEKHVHERLNHQLSKDVGRRDPFTEHDPVEIAEPPWLTEAADFKTEEAATLLKHFKHAKDFFEGDGKRRMLEAFEHYLQTPLHDYIESRREQFIHYYNQQLDTHMHQMQQEMRSQTEEYFEGQVAVLSQPGDSADWQALAHQLELLLKE